MKPLNDDEQRDLFNFGAAQESSLQEQHLAANSYKDPPLLRIGTHNEIPGFSTTSVPPRVSGIMHVDDREVQTRMEAVRGSLAVKAAISDRAAAVRSLRGNYEADQLLRPQTTVDRLVRSDDFGYNASYRPTNDQVRTDAARVGLTSAILSPLSTGPEFSNKHDGSYHFLQSQRFWEDLASLRSEVEKLTAKHRRDNPTASEAEINAIVARNLGNRKSLDHIMSELFKMRSGGVYFVPNPTTGRPEQISSAIRGQVSDSITYLNQRGLIQQYVNIPTTETRIDRLVAGQTVSGTLKPPAGELALMFERPSISLSETVQHELNVHRLKEELEGLDSDIKAAEKQKASLMGTLKSISLEPTPRYFDLQTGITRGKKDLEKLQGQISRSVSTMEQQVALIRNAAVREGVYLPQLKALSRIAATLGAVHYTNTELASKLREVASTAHAALASASGSSIALREVIDSLIGTADQAVQQAQKLSTDAYGDEGTKKDIADVRARWAQVTEQLQHTHTDIEMKQRMREVVQERLTHAQEHYEAAKIIADPEKYLEHRADPRVGVKKSELAAYEGPGAVYGADITPKPFGGRPLRDVPLDELYFVAQEGYQKGTRVDRIEKFEDVHPMTGAKVEQKFALPVELHSQKQTRYGALAAAVRHYLESPEGQARIADEEIRGGGLDRKSYGIEKTPLSDMERSSQYNQPLIQQRERYDQTKRAAVAADPRMASVDFSRVKGQLTEINDYLRYVRSGELEKFLRDELKTARANRFPSATNIDWLEKYLRELPNIRKMYEEKQAFLQSATAFLPPTTVTNDNPDIRRNYDQRLGQLGLFSKLQLSGPGSIYTEQLKEISRLRKEGDVKGAARLQRQREENIKKLEDTFGPVYQQVKRLRGDSYDGKTQGDSFPYQGRYEKMAQGVRSAYERKNIGEKKRDSLLTEIAIRQLENVKYRNAADTDRYQKLYADYMELGMTSDEARHQRLFGGYVQSGMSPNEARAAVDRAKREVDYASPDYDKYRMTGGINEQQAYKAMRAQGKTEAEAREELDRRQGKRFQSSYFKMPYRYSEETPGGDPSVPGRQDEYKTRKDRIREASSATEQIMSDYDRRTLKRPGMTDEMRMYFVADPRAEGWDIGLGNRRRAQINAYLSAQSLHGSYQAGDKAAEAMINEQVNRYSMGSTWKPGQKLPELQLEPAKDFTERQYTEIRRTLNTMRFDFDPAYRGSQQFQNLESITKMSQDEQLAKEEGRLPDKQRIPGEWYKLSDIEERIRYAETPRQLLRAKEELLWTFHRNVARTQDAVSAKTYKMAGPYGSRNIDQPGGKGAMTFEAMREWMRRAEDSDEKEVYEFDLDHESPLVRSVWNVYAEAFARLQAMNGVTEETHSASSGKMRGIIDNNRVDLRKVWVPDHENPITREGMMANTLREVSRFSDEAGLRYIDEWQARGTYPFPYEAYLAHMAVDKNRYELFPGKYGKDIDMYDSEGNLKLQGELPGPGLYRGPKPEADNMSPEAQESLAAEHQDMNDLYERLAKRINDAPEEEREQVRQQILESLGPDQLQDLVNQNQKRNNFDVTEARTVVEEMRIRDRKEQAERDRFDV